jgi:hypothetical protein
LKDDLYATASAGDAEASAIANRARSNEPVKATGR